MEMKINIPDKVHEKLVYLNEKTNIPLSELISMGIEYLDGKNDKNEGKFSELLKEAESEAVIQNMSTLYKDYELVHIPCLVYVKDGRIAGTSEPYNPISFQKKIEG